MMSDHHPLLEAGTKATSRRLGSVTIISIDFSAARALVETISTRPARATVALSSLTVPHPADRARWAAGLPLSPATRDRATTKKDHGHDYHPR